MGKPLYGDVFGTQTEDLPSYADEDDVEMFSARSRSDETDALVRGGGENGVE